MAIDEWRGRIAARWTLVEVREEDGDKYLLARKKRPPTGGPNVLTEREHQVVGCAVMGHHNKLIAFDLGIAASTVRVLIARAAKKLGVRSRTELIRCRLLGNGGSYERSETSRCLR